MNQYRIDYEVTSPQGVRQPQVDFIEAECFCLEGPIIVFYDDKMEKVAIYSTSVRVVLIQPEQAESNVKS